MRINLNIDGAPTPSRSHSLLTLSNLSSFNIASIFRCPLPPRNPVYVRHLDPSVLAFSLSLHRHPNICFHCIMTNTRKYCRRPVLPVSTNPIPISSDYDFLSNLECHYRIFSKHQDARTVGRLSTQLTIVQWRTSMRELPQWAANSVALNFNSGSTPWYPRPPAFLT